jgi:hypothetical protein
MKKFPEKWCIKITAENRDAVKSWFEKNVDGADEYSFSFGCYYHFKLHNIGTMHINPEYREITFEQFKQNIMSKNATIITREQFQKGYKLACSEWQEKLIDTYGKDLAINDTVSIDHDFVDQLKLAASNNLQKTFLQQLFPNPNEISAQDLEVGEIMKVTDGEYTGALLARMHGDDFVNILNTSQTFGKRCSIRGVKVKVKIDVID